MQVVAVAVLEAVEPQLLPLRSRPLQMLQKLQAQSPQLASRYMPKKKNIYYISRAKTNSKNISFKRNSTNLGAVRLRLDGDEAHQGLHSAVRPHNGVASGFTKTGEAVKALQGADEQVNVVQ